MQNETRARALSLVGAVEDNLSLEKILDTLYGMRIRDDYCIGNVKVKLRDFRP